MTEPIKTIEAAYTVEQGESTETESAGEVEIYPNWIYDTAGMWYPRDRVVTLVEE